MHDNAGRKWLTVHTSLAAVAVAGGYLVGTQVGLLLTPRNQPVSLLWPPNALLLAALLLLPRRVWLWCVLAVLPAHFATQLVHGIPLTTSIGWYFTNVGEALLGAYCLTRLRRPAELFETLGGFALFLIVSVIGVTGLTSFLDAAVVIATGSDQGYWPLWQRRFVSNALATLTLVPPLVMLGSHHISSVVTKKPAWFVESALLAVGTLGVVDLQFAFRTETAATIPALLYSVLPLLFWAAIRFGPTGVSLLQLVATGAMLLAARQRDASIHDIWSLQMLMAMLAVLSLSLAVVVRESRRLHVLHSAVLTSMPDAVAIVDPEGIVIESNAAWRLAADASDRSRFVGSGRDVNYLEWCSRRGTHTSDATKLVSGVTAILTGSATLFSMEYVARTGTAARWFFISVVPLHGRRRGAVITHRDITVHKKSEAEMLRMRDELADAGRIMSMGMLSASLTHELTQPLAAVLGNAQAAKRLIARESSQPTELNEMLTDIVSASRRATSMLNRMRTWFKSGHREAQPLSMNDVVAEVVALLQGDLLRREVRIETRLTMDVPTIIGDRTQLQQVVLNLIINACDAMSAIEPARRRIIVRTTCANGRVQLSVEDTGPGFASDRLDALFDPFVTTKPTGLGLGLALCHAIISAHDGELTVVNNAGDGATVYCTLPCVNDYSPVGTA
jgi:C4-dicarboxylate-specific signal transduction histidine kinase